MTTDKTDKSLNIRFGMDIRDVAWEVVETNQLSFLNVGMHIRYQLIYKIFIY